MSPLTNAQLEVLGDTLRDCTGVESVEIQPTTDGARVEIRAIRKAHALRAIDLAAQIIDTPVRFDGEGLAANNSVLVVATFAPVLRQQELVSILVPTYTDLVS